MTVGIIPMLGFQHVTQHWWDCSQLIFESTVEAQSRRRTYGIVSNDSPLQALKRKRLNIKTQLNEGPMPA